MVAGNPFWRRIADMAEANKGNTPRWLSPLEEAELTGWVAERIMADGLSVVMATCLARRAIECSEQDEIVELLAEVQ